jgi:hypothetical protein
MLLPISERGTGFFLADFVDSLTRTTAASLYTVPVQGPSEACEESFEKEEYSPETETVRRKTSKEDLPKERLDMGDVITDPFCRQYYRILCLIYAKINRKIDHRAATYMNNCAIIPAIKQRKNPNTPKLNSIFTVP